jgi:hypothetical protein
MASIYDKGCCEILKLEAGERDHPANCWGWVASTVAPGQVNPKLESLHNSWVLLIKILKDHKSFEIVVETWDRLEKILEI